MIEKNGKVLLLAYDQGFEHGPVDFDETNVDPKHIMKIATNGNFTGVVFHEGVASRYYDKECGVPLVIKLNGKTSFYSEEPRSLQLCTVDKAVSLGAKAVGYTIYVGSKYEEEMMVEFSRIEDEAHAKGLTVIAWMYPRGSKVAGRESERDVVAYAARLGLELNADYVKVPYTGDVESFSWVVRAAGKTGVLAQGGKKIQEESFLAEAREIMEAGAKGFAVGRNIWQDKNPDSLSLELGRIVFGNE